MDPRVAKLKTPDECEIFAANCAERGQVDLAHQARRRSLALRAGQYGAGNLIEKECLEAIYAYEEALRLKHGKRVRANRTWQVIKSKGVIQAVDDIVSHDTTTVAFDMFEKMGLLECAFESVVLRHPNKFSSEALRKARARLKAYK